MVNDNKLIGAGLRHGEGREQDFQNFYGLKSTQIWSIGYKMIV